MEIDSQIQNVICGLDWEWERKLSLHIAEPKWWMPDWLWRAIVRSVFIQNVSEFKRIEK